MISKQEYDRMGWYVNLSNDIGIFELALLGRIGIFELALP